MKCGPIQFALEPLQDNQLNLHSFDNFLHYATDT